MRHTQRYPERGYRDRSGLQSGYPEHERTFRNPNYDEDFGPESQDFGERHSQEGYPEERAGRWESEDRHRNFGGEERTQGNWRTRDRLEPRKPWRDYGHGRDDFSSQRGFSQNDYGTGGRFGDPHELDQSGYAPDYYSGSSRNYSSYGGNQPSRAMSSGWPGSESASLGGARQPGYSWGDDRHQGGRRMSGPTQSWTRSSGPKGYTRSDERLKEDICEQLTQCGVDVSDVSVEVKSGKVTLEGSVDDRRSKHIIEDTADNCMGVKDIDNRVRVTRGRDLEAGSESGSDELSASRSGSSSSRKTN